MGQFDLNNAINILTIISSLIIVTNKSTNTITEKITNLSASIAHIEYRMNKNEANEEVIRREIDDLKSQINELEKKIGGLYDKQSR